MTPEQTKSPYQRVCEQECEGCADELPFAVEDRSVHLQLTGDMWPNAVLRHPCTAPSKDALIERQAAQIAAMQAALAKGGHTQWCSSNSCRHCGNHSAPCWANYSHHHKFEGHDCTCPISTLSDDIERGKELLGAVEELKLWRKFLNPGEELSNAIARLNDDAMKERP